MLIRVPAILFGIVVVFITGVRFCFAVLDDFEKMKRGIQILNQEIIKKIEMRSYVGGVLSVVFLITILVTVSEQWQNIILSGLTILGIIFALLTFFGPSKTPLPRSYKSETLPNHSNNPYSEPKIIIPCKKCS